MVQGTPERLPFAKKTICRLAKECFCDDVQLEAIYEVVQLKGVIIRRLGFGEGLQHVFLYEYHYRRNRFLEFWQPLQRIRKLLY